MKCLRDLYYSQRASQNEKDSWCRFKPGMSVLKRKGPFWSGFHRESPTAASAVFATAPPGGGVPWAPPPSAADLPWCCQEPGPTRPPLRFLFYFVSQFLFPCRSWEPFSQPIRGPFHLFCEQFPHGLAFPPFCSILLLPVMII